MFTYLLTHVSRGPAAGWIYLEVQQRADRTVTVVTSTVPSPAVGKVTDRTLQMVQRPRVYNSCH